METDFDLRSVKKEGMDIGESFYLCKDEEESVVHILLFSTQTRLLQHLLFSLFGVEWVLLSSVGEVLFGRHKRFMGKKHIKEYRIASLWFFWVIWIEKIENMEKFDQAFKTSFLSMLLVVG